MISLHHRRHPIGHYSAETQDFVAGTRVFPRQPVGECACIGTDQFVDENGSPDIVSVGSPCQAFSFNGAGDGLADPRSALIRETVRIAHELRPAFLLIENVPALKSRGADTIIEALETSGYSTQAFVVGASDLKGGRHKRKRAWLVAYDTTQRIQGLRPERQQVAHSLAPPLLPLGGRDGQWEIEPDVRRAVNGDPRWMDRLACIGNSIVPQIPVMFFDWMREVTRKERFTPLN